MAGGKNCHKVLKICCGVTCLFLIILLVVLVILFLTILKPKQPLITAHPVRLRNIEIQLSPVLELNATLDLVITVSNRNYASFEHDNGTAFVDYRGTTVAEAPIMHDTIPARAEHNISTSVEIFADKLISNPYFIEDFLSGSVNFSSSTRLHGKVTLLKILKMRVTAYNTCDISIFVLSRNISSKCYSKVKI